LANTYNVCLTGKSNFGCSNTICNALPVGTKGIIASLMHTSIADSVNIKAAVSGGTAPYSYLWNFGDGQQSTLASPSHVYLHSGSYPVTLMVKDAAGKIGMFNYNLVTGNDNSSCAANYSISAIRSAVAGSQNWTKIALKYRSADGNLYSTALIDQNLNSKFEIVSVSDAGLNENGAKLKKVELKFSALLSNGIENIEITNGRAFIAVAYK
jgi:PKD repeat protein